MAQVATGAHGKGLANLDLVTINGQVTNISGSGPAATITVKLAGSGNSVSVKANDIAGHAQTT
jgi:hypothetical protein